MRATIKDIAEKAGVSVATVSRAINGMDGMGEDTRKRILKIAEALNYHANLWARGLVLKKGNVFEIVIPQTSEFAFSNPFYAEILKGIGKKARELGKHLLLSFAGKESYVTMYRHGLSAGIIVVGNRIDDPEITEAWKAKVPLVLIPGYPGEKGIPSIDCESSDGSSKAVDYLVSLGHRQIGFLNGPQNSKFSIERLAGYIEALKKNGLPFQKELVLESDFTQEGAYEGMKKFLSWSKVPTAVIIINDYSALGALKAAKEMGYRVPQDISIVGFGDVPFASMVTPPLTTIREPFQRMGYEAAVAIIKLIEGKRLLKNNVVFPVELIIRESTAPPPSMRKK
jgi:LacI family transcriptional regulator